MSTTVVVVVVIVAVVVLALVAFAASRSRARKLEENRVEAREDRERADTTARKAEQA
jgi:FtsZ-interacting cell division protein ZipA